MQFSIPPWHYNDRKTIAIAKCMIEQHKHYVVPVAMRFLGDWRAATAAGSRSSAWLESPLTFSLMKPLWNVAQNDDHTALTIDDEFMLGDKILLAPMVTAGDHRDIYLPFGHWRDQLRRVTWTGPKWLTRFEIAEHEIAIFIKCETVLCSEVERHPVCLDKKKRKDEL